MVSSSSGAFGADELGNPRHRRGHLGNLLDVEAHLNLDHGCLTALGVLPRHCHRARRTAGRDLKG